MGRWPGSWGSPSGRWRRQPGDPRPLPQPGGGRGGTVGGAIHPAGCLGGGDGRRAAGFCQPVGFAPVSGEPDLPADAARRGGAETADYLRQKLQQAQWALTCVQRRQKTLEACVQALVQAQAAYFRGCQAAPGPLLRREVAEQLGVHPSTVTRALGHKYLQCRQGLFPMGYFLPGPWGRRGPPPSG